MKKILFSLAILISTATLAQRTSESKYTFGFGANFIDNRGSGINNKFFKTKDLNAIPSISTFTVQRKMAENLSLSGQFFLNEFDKSNKQNGTYIEKSVTYVSVNLNALYTFDSHLVDVKWFDASVIAGVGALWLDSDPNQTINAGFAFDFWLSKNVGLRLETQGKFAFDKNVVANNHIVHAASLILPIN